MHFTFDRILRMRSSRDFDPLKSVPSVSGLWFQLRAPVEGGRNKWKTRTHTPRRRLSTGSIAADDLEGVADIEHMSTTKLKLEVMRLRQKLKGWSLASVTSPCWPALTANSLR